MTSFSKSADRVLNTTEAVSYQSWRLQTAPLHNYGRCTSRFLMEMRDFKPEDFAVTILEAH
jgi:hypothetical protein